MEEAIHRIVLTAFGRDDAAVTAKTFHSPVTNVHFKLLLFDAIAFHFDDQTV